MILVVSSHALITADASSIGSETIVVYRVKDCAACSEIEGLKAGDITIVNLMLMCPPARRLGLQYRLPEQVITCTYEIQISTAAIFKKLTKGVEAHDRANLVSDVNTMMGKLNSLASGSQGKIVMPGVGKGGVIKGGNAERGKRMIDVFNAVDIMHPMPDQPEIVTLSGLQLDPERCAMYERDRMKPGSRWFMLWSSDQRIFAIQALTLKTAGKVPPLGKFAVLLSGVLHDGGVMNLYEDLLIKLPVSKGDVWIVQDGLLPSGQLLGNLSLFKSIQLEYFEHQRGSQWVDLSDVTIKAVLDAPAQGLLKEGDESPTEPTGDNSRKFGNELAQQSPDP